MNSDHDKPQGSNPYASPQSQLGGSRVDDAPLASLLQRLGGAFVDGALMWTCLIAPFLVAGDMQLLAEGLQSEDPERIAEAISGGAYTATPILILLLVGFNLWLLYKDGQTIGKRLVGSRIVRSSGERAGFLRIVVLREVCARLLYMIPLLGPVLMFFGHAVILLNQRRCLHDFVADTKVVRA